MKNSFNARSTAEEVLSGIDLSGKTTPLACDLSDLSSVKVAIATLLAAGRPVDRVIANASIFAPPRLEQCPGVEKQFVVNYLGHFVLITGILHAIPQHAGARIVIVSSSAHTKAAKAGIEFDNLFCERDYNGSRFYGQSNVARILFTRALARRVGSRLFTKSIPQGAATQCYLAAHPEVEGVTGKYFSDCRIAESSHVTQGNELGERLWTVSDQLITRVS